MIFRDNLKKTLIADKCKICHTCMEYVLIFPDNYASQLLVAEFDAKHRGHAVVISNVNDTDLKMYRMFKREEI